MDDDTLERLLREIKLKFRGSKWVEEQCVTCPSIVFQSHGKRVQLKTLHKEVLDPIVNGLHDGLH